MKNWRPFLLSLLSLPSLWLSHTAHAEPMVWKATKGQQQLMLIGTIHLGDKSMYPLPMPLENFLKISDGLVLETDVEDAPDLDFTGVLLTRDVLNNQQQLQLEAVAQELKLNPQVLLDIPPWLTAVTIENQTFQKLGFDADSGVDQTLLKQAQSLNVPLLTFETMAEQLNVLQTLPDNGKDLLLESISDEQNNTDIYTCLIQSWKDGDKETLLDILETADWDDATSSQLLTSRNKKWIEKIIDPQFLSPTGKYVIAVGALHLIGQHNLRELLGQQGYEIELLTTSKTAQCR